MESGREHQMEIWFIQKVMQCDFKVYSTYPILKLYTECKNVASHFGFKGRVLEVREAWGLRAQGFRALVVP